jgi:hypothetical protein
MNGYTTPETGLAPAICKASPLRSDEGLGRWYPTPHSLANLLNHQNADINMQRHTTKWWM